MSDASLNRFLARGTAADRAAFTPAPPTPASGPDPVHLWYETDTGDTYAWDGAAWQQVNTSGAPPAWGDITGTLSDQTDLQTALDAKANAADIGTAGALDVDVDDTLAANSDTVVPSQQAVKAYVDGAIAGAGGGDMLAANNLSDVADVPTARTNLDVYSKAEVDSAVAGGGGGGGTSFEAGPVTAPTTTDLATWVNQGTSTVSNGTGALILRPQADGLLHGLEKVAPSVPFDVYCRFDAITMSDAATTVQLDNTAGVILRDSSDGELILCGVYFQRASSQNSYSVVFQRWTASGATFSANAVRFYLPIAPQWLRVNVTSTTITLYVSADGKNFIQVPTTETVSAFIDNVDRIGIGATSDSDIDSAAILCSYFSTTAPA